MPVLASMQLKPKLPSHSYIRRQLFPSRPYQGQFDIGHPPPRRCQVGPSHLNGLGGVHKGSERTGIQSQIPLVGNFGIVQGNFGSNDMAVGEKKKKKRKKERDLLSATCACKTQTTLQFRNVPIVQGMDYFQGGILMFQMQNRLGALATRRGFQQAGWLATQKIKLGGNPHASNHGLLDWKVVALPTTFYHGQSLIGNSCE